MCAILKKILTLTVLSTPRLKTAPPPPTPIDDQYHIITENNRC